MNDFVWFVIIGILFVLLGFVFFMLGWQIWKKQKMNLIISFHCDKVSEENKQAYCTLTGIGVLLMGIGFFLSAICAIVTQTVFALIPMTAGLILGIVLLTVAVKKYNQKS